MYICNYVNIKIKTLYECKEKKDYSINACTNYNT